ncbi:MAG TPA: hypothetical protein VIA63_01335 [Candidatus Limnocylindria bacterium]|jgi:hypothetical protein
MTALTQASAQRTEHELAVHGYQHVRLEEHTKAPAASARFVAKRGTT